MSAVRKVAEGRTTANVIVFGVPEEQEEIVDNKVRLLLESLEEKHHTTECCKIGQSKPGMVKSSNSVYHILRKAKQLKDTEGYKRVFITPDKTVEEQISRQKLVKELKEKRAADLNKHYIIRKGEVVFLILTYLLIVFWYPVSLYSR